jgi:hypothetical protein
MIIGFSRAAHGGTGYTVSGAGYTAVNGHYSVYGTNDGVTDYKHDTATFYISRTTTGHTWHVASAVTGVAGYGASVANAATPDTATAGTYAAGMVPYTSPGPTVTGPN